MSLSRDLEFYGTTYKYSEGYRLALARAKCKSPTKVVTPTEVATPTSGRGVARLLWAAYVKVRGLGRNGK